MKRLRSTAALVLAFAAAGCVQAPPAGPFGGWNPMHGEKVAALAATGDAARGAIAFEVCQGCHRAGALGRPDGSYPRLAGQHPSVLIKQMTDIRAGVRLNPAMRPFIAGDVVDTQGLADIAAYLAALPSPPTNGHGPATDVARGEQVYRRDCAGCHGIGGEGDAKRFHPRLSGQHYAYLLREMVDVRDGVRGNAHPQMVDVVRRLGEADLAAAADYVSRLPTGPD